MSNTIEQRIHGIKNWLILNSGAVPYIIAYGFRQWTDGTYRRYPENYLVSLCGYRFTKAGSEAQFFSSKDEYRDSFLKIINHRDIIEKLYADFLIDEENFKNFIELIKKNGETYLNENFAEFIRLYDAEYISAVTIDGALVYGEEFFNEMKEKYPQHGKELLILTKQYGETFINRYRQELLKIAIKHASIKLNSVDEILQNVEIKSELEKIQTAFHWIKNNYKNVKALPLSFFVEQFWELISDATIDYAKELSELEAFSNNHHQACAEIKNNGVFDLEDYEKLLWLGKIAWWVDRRKEYNLIANYYIGKHLEWLCDKHQFVYEEVAFLLPWELDEVMAGKKTIKDYDIAGRKSEGLYFRDIDGQELFLTGPMAKDLWLEINPPIKLDETKEIKGMVAYGGKVRGIVRVIMDPHNPGEFNAGDILVTGMTRPDFLSLMKQASAFVTDEGGITCHAAIVSRELKRPCLVGTKIATQILHDGDEVEVDADQGVVTIINKKIN